MAPNKVQKGTKRAAGSELEGAPAQKKSPHDSMFAGIAEALGGTENMAPDTRDMLVSMVPGCLRSAKDERHKYQDAAVKMIGNALDRIRADKESAIASENETLAGAEATKAQLDEAQTVAAELLASKAAVSKEKKNTLVQDSIGLSKGKQSLAEAQAAQTKGDAEHVKVQAELTGYEAAMEQSFKPLKAGAWDDEAEPKKHLDALQPFVAQIELEESLRSSLQAAGIKKLSDRGAFDNMVLDELEKVLVGKLESLRAAVATGAPAAAERAAAVQAAQASVDEAKGKVHTSATALNVAQAEETEQAAVLKSAEKAVKDFGPGFRKATAARDSLTTDLESFDNFPLASFSTLRERVSQKTEAPEEPEEPVAAEA